MDLSNWDLIPLDGVKGVLLDLDNTLYNYDKCHHKAMEACMMQASVKFGIKEDIFSSLLKDARNRVHKDLHGQGASHSRLLYFQKLYENYAGYTNAEFALNMETLYWDVFLTEMTWYPGAKEFIESGLGRGIKFCIVTDLTAQIQLQKFLHLGLQNLVHFLLSSEEAGIEKPNPYIFELALEKLKLSASDVIMIGDSLEKDIKGAENLGIKAYLIKDNTILF
jgi:putative hydrolase of the HAD superfamily